jgi:transcriptional antiterminator Rof (Rho-off)
VETPYEPVPCALHSELEAAATLGETVEIRVRDPAGADPAWRGRVLDVHARDGAEYLVLALPAGGRVTLRLDRVLALTRGPG